VFWCIHKLDKTICRPVIVHSARQQPRDEKLPHCVGRYGPTRLHKADSSRTTATGRLTATPEMSSSQTDGLVDVAKSVTNACGTWLVNDVFADVTTWPAAAFIDKKLSCRSESARRSTAFERFLMLITRAVLALSYDSTCVDSVCRVAVLNWFIFILIYLFYLVKRTQDVQGKKKCH